jgi:glycosyltransferase involved in cell wall biosynthesis
MRNPITQTAFETSYDFRGPPDLSLVIPVYNEQDILVANLRKLLLFFQDKGLDAEIILGSNGSTDATVEIGTMIETIRPGRIRFFHISSRGAVGEVFKKAAELVSAPVLISMDMDLSVDLEFITAALDLLKTCDLIVGSKKSGIQNRSPLRLLGSKFFILCANALLRLPWDDYSIGAKGYKISSVRPLLRGISKDTNYVLDLLSRAQKAGLRIEVLPIACSDWRTSHFGLFKEAFTRFSYLFRLWIGKV